MKYVEDDSSSEGRSTDSVDQSGDEDNNPEVNKEIVARIIAMRLAEADKAEIRGSPKSKREDPLERLRRMDEEKEEKDTSQRSSEVKTQRPVSHKQYLQEETLTSAEKEIVARIVAIRIAQVDEAEPDSSWNVHPEDPLERVMNMNAEDLLISAVSLMHHSVSQNDSDDDDDNDMIRKKDFRDLSKMILENNLEDLERQAAAMASSVKIKLQASSLADLSCENDATADSDTGLGYLALAMGGHKVVANRSDLMGGLDVSKITDDDEGDRRFVSMSDSILDSSVQINEDPGKIRMLAGERDSFCGSSDSIEQGQSLIARNMDIPAKNTSNHLSPRGLEKKLSHSKKASSQQLDDPLQSKSVFGSDWWGVLGDFEGIPSGEWSDSQSTMSYAESLPSCSMASLGASTQTSGYETPRPIVQKPTFDTLTPREKDRVLAPVNPDGPKIEHNIEVYCYENALKPKPVHHSLSLLEQKRRRKRELEAWRASLSTSFQQYG